MDATSQKRPLVLVSNDDGVNAPGISALAEAMARLGDVYVAAPLLEQSAVGHAITLRDPVRAFPMDARMHGAVRVYGVQGTPADCVKLAIRELLPREPDLVVSGINQGANTALNAIYSGTVSAATEAAILGVDAVAVSLCDWEARNFDASREIACAIARRVLAQGLPRGILLNVNIPPIPLSSIRGLLVTRQARSRWRESFDQRLDPNNRPYYWMTGTFDDEDDRQNTDVAAVKDGYVSITPMHYDLTAHDFLAPLSAWSWEGIQENSD